MRKYQFHDGENGAAIAIRVIPRAKKNKISEILSDGTIKIRITAPPVDRKANTALIRFLSDILDIPKSRIDIVAGEKSRNKLVSIYGLNPTIVNKRIEQYIE